MSCKSAISTANANINVPVEGIIPLGGIVRRFGRNVNLEGNGIELCGQGYFDLDVSVTLTAPDAGTVTVTALVNGVPLAGATASETLTAGATANLSFPGLIRNKCCDSSSTLTLRLSGVAALVNNVGIVVEKI